MINTLVTVITPYIMSNFPEHYRYYERIGPTPFWNEISRTDAINSSGEITYLDTTIRPTGKIGFRNGIYDLETGIFEPNSDE